jgi:acyl-CoA thioester hydrolase
MIARTSLRVRYKDTDCMQVVYYGNYLTYFEVGRVEFLRQNGWPMSEVNRRVHLPVVEATVRYLRPARLDDLLEISCWISERKRASFRFAYEIGNEARETVARGTTLHACWDPGTSKMIAVPPWLQAIMPVATPGPSEGRGAAVEGASPGSGERQQHDGRRPRHSHPPGAQPPA